MKPLPLTLAAMWNKRNSTLGMMMIEVMLALTVVVLVLVALTAAATIALRNSKYAQNVVLANHYAQQGLESTRQQRDEAATWDDFINEWDSPPESIDGIFEREILLEDTSPVDVDKRLITVTVSWTESGKDHQAKAVTILSKWQ